MGFLGTKSALLCGCIVVMGVSSPSLAQTEAEGATGSGVGFGEIIVTAQRREERNQDVPIAVTAFSPDTIEKNNISRPQDLAGLVPSLTVGSKGQGSRETESPTIRGQGATFQASPGVVLYLNEVPLPAAVSLSQQGGPGNFVDLENVQVLAGPQGTLFGRNTTGGAVLLVPKKPTNNLEGYLEGSYGNYNFTGLEGVVNVPLIDDTLMIRASGAYQDRKGFTEDLVWNKRRDDLHWYSGRIGILMKPTERITNYFMAYGARSSNNGTGIINGGFNIPALTAYGLCQEGAGTASVASCDVYRQQTEIANEIGPRKTRHGVDSFQNVRTWGITNTTDLELSDALTLRNIVSYQRLKSDYSYDSDGTPLQQADVNVTRVPDFPVAGVAPLGYFNAANNPNPRDNLKQFTEELQLQGTALGEKLNYTVGAFYFNATPASPWQTNDLVFCPAAFTGYCAPSTQISSLRNKSKALYGQFTLDMGALTPALDRLKLTAGYRYTWDTIIGSTISYSYNPDGASVTCAFNGVQEALGDAANCLLSGKLKSKAPTWTIGLDYKPIDDLMLYAKVSRGYKAGGFNPYAVRLSTAVFKPEKLTSYEAGFKYSTRLGDVPFLFNGTYYYSDYKDSQTSAGDFNVDTGVSGAQFLGADATIQGIEAELKMQPARWLSLGATVSHTDGDYKRASYVATSPSVGCNGAVAPGGVVDTSCLQVPYIVPWMYSINATVDLPIPESLGKMSLFASYAHQSAQSTSPTQLPGNEPGSVIGSFGLLNLSLDWKDVAGSRFDIGLFATNVTNEKYRVMNTNVFNSLLSQGQLYGQPRMYGVKLRYSFGD